MRFVIACLVMLFPAWLLHPLSIRKINTSTATAILTPAFPFKGTQPAHVAHHRHKASKHPVTAKPAAVNHHRRAVHHKEEATGNGYPGRQNIVSSNKLALPAGKSIYAPGQIVYISGRVLDMRCVPVSDAIVRNLAGEPRGKLCQILARRTP